MDEKFSSLLVGWSKKEREGEVLQHPERQRGVTIRSLKNV
jgi:hypothetical protein